MDIIQQKNEIEGKGEEDNEQEEEGEDVAKYSYYCYIKKENEERKNERF